MPDWPEGARAVLHVDMDAFYASVEELDRPDLKGKPVIVGGRKDARGVVSAASYAARHYGVRSAMPLRLAARLCPGGIFLPVRMERYLEVSRRVFQILDRYSPLVEPLSVDEAFLDATGCERLHGGPVEMGRRIRAEIARDLRLTASVGVAPNKFVAKIASDLRKPDALVVVLPGEVESFLAPLPVERMWGVGPRGAALLRRAGITSFAQLVAAGHARLQPLFGSGADQLVALARGEDARPVVPERAAKSVGSETTFPENVSDPGTLHATLVGQVDRVGARLRSHGLRASVVTLKVRYAPFRTVTRRTTLPSPTCATASLLHAADRLFREQWTREAGPVRLLGVSCSGFSAQALLFDVAEPQEYVRLDRAVDEVRRRFGTDALRRGSVLESGAG